MNKKEFLIAKIIAESKHILSPEIIKKIKGTFSTDQMKYLTTILLVELGKKKLERNGEVLPVPKKQLSEKSGAHPFSRDKQGEVVVIKKEGTRTKSTQVIKKAFPGVDEKVDDNKLRKKGIDFKF